MAEESTKNEPKKVEYRTTSLTGAMWAFIAVAVFVGAVIGFTGGYVAGVVHASPSLQGSGLRGGPQDFHQSDQMPDDFRGFFRGGSL